MKTKEIRVTVLRKGPSRKDKVHSQTYMVPCSEGMSVLNILRYINETYDGGLAYYASCRIGVCQGCFALVNGRPVKICTEMVTHDFTIAPLKGHRIVKDLVVDPSRDQKTED